MLLSPQEHHERLTRKMERQSTKRLKTLSATYLMIKWSSKIGSPQRMSTMDLKTIEVTYHTYGTNLTTRMNLEKLSQTKQRTKTLTSSEI